MKNGQKLSEPTVASAAPTKAPDPINHVTVQSDRILLFKPIIRLNANFSSDLKRPVDTQSMNLQPERAYIAHGCIFVDELKVWFPLNTVQIGRWP